MHNQDTPSNPMPRPGLVDAGQLTRRHLLAMTAAGAAGLAIGGATGVAAQDGAASRGGSVRGAVVSPTTSMDPYTSKAASGDQISYKALYNNLLEVGGTGEFYPELASEWTISDDGLTYTFSLVEGVTFHDGTSLDAEAIKVNIERYMAEGSSFGGADRLRVISAIDASDPATLVITLSEPNAPFLVSLSACYIVSPKAIAEMGEDLTLHGVGSGPFTFVSWEPNSSAVFARNENYWQIAPDGEPFPYLDEFIVEGVPDDSVRLLNLRSDQFQVIERINPRDIPSVQNDPSIQVIETAHATPNLVAMNPNTPPFDNKLLRQALSHAIDRQAIVDNISFGTGYVTPMPFPKDAWFFIDEPTPVYDPERAKALLVEAGYPDGLEVPMTHINRTIDTQIAQILKAQLEAVGITMTIESLERTTWVDMWAAGDGQLGLLQGGMAPTDPDTQTGIFRKDNLSNWTKWDNPQLQALIDQSNETTDQEERLAVWREIAALVVDEAVYVFIGAIPTIAGLRSTVQDLEFVGGQHWEVTSAHIEE